MRVLFAYDASPSADQAGDLIAGLTWPPGSQIDVVSVHEPLALRVPVGPPELLSDLRFDKLIEADLDEKNGAVVERLRTAGLHAKGTTASGRPATVLAEAARVLAADLVVTGSRGLGRIASLVLGSVSAELIDNTSSPVLVARGSKFERVLLATDGSSDAAHAVDVVESWPIFAGALVRVLSVADVQPNWTIEIAPEYAFTFGADSGQADDIVAEHHQIASMAATELLAAGRSAEGHVVSGDPATEIVEEAVRWSADVVVLGSRGQVGIKRLVLGSVARNVLVASEAPSVLVVHRRRGGRRPSGRLRRNELRVPDRGLALATSSMARLIQGAGLASST